VAAGRNVKLPPAVVTRTTPALVPAGTVTSATCWSKPRLATVLRRSPWPQPVNGDRQVSRVQAVPSNTMGCRRNRPPRERSTGHNLQRDRGVASQHVERPGAGQFRHGHRQLVPFSVSPYRSG